MSNATYRFELSKTGRAGCQNSACKSADLKIEKGELRFGTLVNIKDHFTWKWKHWGCVTPSQIKNIQEQVGPLDDLDLDEDLPSILDGYDELSPEAREKVKFALIHGHVADEDWKGDPEKNRPGQKGINKRTPKKKKDAEEDEEAPEIGEDTPSKPKARKSRAKKVKPEPEDDEDDLALSPPPEKKSRGRKRKVADEDEEAAEDTKPKRKSRAKKFKTEEQDAAMDSDQPLNLPKPKASGKRGKKQAIGDEEPDEEPSNDQIDGSDYAPAAEPVMKGKRGKSKKVKRESPDEDDVPVTSKAKATKSKKANKLKPEPEEEFKSEVKQEDSGEDGLSAPEAASAAAVDEDDVEEPETKPKRQRAAKGKAKAKSRAT